MARVLVTGGSGFIGRHLVEQFAAAPGFEVICTQHASLTPTLSLAVATTHADLGTPEECDALIRRWQPDVIVHAASQPVMSDRPLAAINQSSAHWILDAASRLNPRTHVILLGSAAEYGLPTGDQRLREDQPCFAYTAYGRAKLSATEDAMYRTRRGETRATVLRLFNVIGPGIGTHLPLGAFLGRYALGDPHQARRTVRMGPIDAIRDFIRISDVGRAAERVVTRSVVGEVINVCTGRGRPLRELLMRMAALMGAEVEIQSTPEPPATGLHPIVGDPDKCAALLGFTPADEFDDTLVQTWTHAMMTAAREVPQVPDVPALAPDALR